MAGEEQETKSQTKYAHFEAVPNYTLHDLYSRHAEVARQIHEDTLRRVTGNNSLTVDLVRSSPLNPKGPEIIEKLTQYDVVSVSSGVDAFAGIISPSGIATGTVVDMYKKAFAEEEMPIYVVAAGNNGKTNAITQVRVADFGRNTLVVGEANKNDQGHYIEEHSSRINPTLASDNPFNRGERYQYFDPSPSLVGHENLVRNWVIENHIQQGIDLFTLFNKDKNLDEDYLNKAKWGIYNALSEKYHNTEEGQAWAQKQAEPYLANPESLHKIIFAQLQKENEGLDAQGFVGDIDGTSFSAPEQAGYISAALYEQEQRHENKLPALTEDEITTLVKMATLDTQTREGQEKPMPDNENNAGHVTVWGAGHGVFHPEMFRKLLDESYQRIGTNPDINRNSMTTTLQAELPEGHKGSDVIKINPDLPKDTDMVIDRMRVDINMRVNGLYPHLVEINSDNISNKTHRLIHVENTDRSETSWARIENSFGEKLSSGDKWKVRLPDGQDATLNNVSITVYGYEKGGLMEQMMAYSKDLAKEMTPKAPEQEQPQQNQTIIQQGQQKDQVGIGMNL